MPSPHVIQILRSKTRLSDDEIIKLTNAQAWKAIYEAEKGERERRELLRKPEICFTGFNYEERENLETEAVIKGLKVRKRVTVDLGYLVIGDTPGEKKIELALEQGVEILRLEEYEKKEFFVKKPKVKTKKRKTLNPIDFLSLSSGCPVHVRNETKSIISCSIVVSVPSAYSTSSPYSGCGIAITFPG